MEKNQTVHTILEDLDGYLISIERNIDTGMYELKVGFRKNWVFKGTDDVECTVETESENGTIAIISAKYEDVIIDDLIDFVVKVINTNQKITELNEKFEKQLEQRKKELEEEILKFDEEIEEFKKNSFERLEEKVEKKPKKRGKKDRSDVFTNEDEEVIQKIS